MLGVTFVSILSQIRASLFLLQEFGYVEVPAVSKRLMCGDTGHGAMAEVDTVLEEIFKRLTPLH